MSATIKEDLQRAMRDAMKAKDADTLSIIRLALNAINNQEKEKQTALTEAEGLTLLQKMVKQGEDSAKQYADANRPELADKEKKEVGILRTFLPTQLSDAELETLINEAISTCDAQTMKDMGRLMQHIKPLVVGRVEAAKLSQIIRARLS